MDILGWKFSIATNDIQVSQIGFIGIAVALLGRGGRVGIALAALLFGGLQVGTSTRALDPTVFPPELAGNLATIIQGADRALRRRRARRCWILRLAGAGGRGRRRGWTRASAEEAL